MSTTRTIPWEMERGLIHQNARKHRESFCSWCGYAVPARDFSTKFAQAGGVLAGPFCSPRCYWHFITTNEWHDLTRRERREYYDSEQ